MQIYIYSVLFIVNASEMTLEILASRLLSPYIGNSEYVWISIIGVMLLASSIGNWLGGRALEKFNSPILSVYLLLIAGIFCAMIPEITLIVEEIIKVMKSPAQINGILSSVMLFMIPNTATGMLTPILTKDIMQQADKRIGNVYACMTMGSLFGTYAGGFLLVPRFGTVSCIGIISALIFTMAIVLTIKYIHDPGVLKHRIIIYVMIAALYAVICYKHGLTLTKEASGNTISIDTQYGHVLVYDSMYHGSPFRFMKIDGGYESGTYIEENKKNDLAFEYTQTIQNVIDQTQKKKALMFGGAAYQLPKYMISHDPDTSVDVAEIDPGVTEIAKQYFYLDDLYRDFDLEKTNRLRILHEDGRVVINQSNDIYDVIINDAFSGNTPPPALTTKECIQRVRSHLTDDGIYILNLLSALEGDTKWMEAEINTLKQVFPYIYAIDVSPEIESTKHRNIIIVAAQQKLKLNNDLLDITIPEGTPVLTDDYCPVETMIPQY